MATKRASKKAAAAQTKTVAEKAVVEEVKETVVEKEAEVKEAAVEIVEVKEEKKAPAKKAAPKKTAVKEEVVLQFAGKEVNTADIMKNVKDIWTKVLKNKVGDMKSVSIYLKPEECAAYYVVNGDVTGKIEL